MTNDKRLVVTYQDLIPEQVLIGDKDYSFEVMGIGDIDFPILDVTDNLEIDLKNVLYAPTMRRNLIGGSNIDIAGNQIQWGNNKMIKEKYRIDFAFTKG